MNDSYEPSYQDKKLSLILQNRKNFDDTDLKILMNLKMDSRISIVKLARKMGLKEVTITRRIQNLLDQNIIECTCTLINYNKLGFSLKAVILLKVDNENVGRVSKILKKNMQMLELNRIIDTFEKHSIECKMVFKDIEDLKEFSNSVKKINGIEELDYYIIYKSFKHDFGEGTTKNELNITVKSGHDPVQ